jgi:hypothetical protein
VTQVADELRTEMGSGLPEPNRPVAPQVNGAAAAQVNRDAAEFRPFEHRLSKLEERIDRNDMALRRALTVITKKLDGGNR